MPHKRNPVLTENLTGSCPPRAGMAVPAMENVAVARTRHLPFLRRAHYRPDATVTLDFAWRALTGVVDKLLVYPPTCRRTSTASAARPSAARVLLALTQKGRVAREDSWTAYVQRNAMPVWRGEGDS